MRLDRGMFFCRQEDYFRLMLQGVCSLPGMIWDSLKECYLNVFDINGGND